MRIYTVHIRKAGVDSEKDFQLVREGFSWTAFFFGPIWALWYGLWKEALVIGGVAIFLSIAFAIMGMGADGQIMAWIGFAAIVGYLADDLKRCALSRDGMESSAVISGKNEDDAARRFLDIHPDLVRELLA